MKKATMNLRTGEVKTNFDYSKKLPFNRAEELYDINDSRNVDRYNQQLEEELKNEEALKILQGTEYGVPQYHLGMGYVFCLPGQSNKAFLQAYQEAEVEKIIYNIGHFYGSIIPTYDIRAAEVHRSSADVVEQAKVACRRVKKYFSNVDITELKWKLIMGDAVVYYTLEWTGTGEEELDVFRFMVHMISNDPNEYLYSYTFLLQTSTESISPMIYTVAGKDKKDTMKGIQMFLSAEKLTEYTMEVIRRGIEAIRIVTSSNQDRYKKLIHDGFCHTENEIVMIKRLMKDWDPPLIIRPILNHDWLNDDIRNDTRIYDATSQCPTEGRPIIEFSSGEWSKIRNYIQEQYPEDTPILMQRILHHLPYGDKLLIKYPILFKKDIIPIEVNIDIIDASLVDDDGSEHLFENVEITVCFRNDNLCQYIAHAQIHELNDKFGVESEAQLIFTAPLMHHTKLVKTQEELLNLYPKSVVELFTCEENALALISDIIGMLIIMHDRPEKFVEIEEKTRRGNLPKNPYGKSPPKEKDFVTRYIIKTIYQGRKYVKQRTDGDTIRRYVTEHWKRRGHWRKLKSGKEIWIEETNCTRHLDISNTPVIINYEEEMPKQYNVV